VPNSRRGLSNDELVSHAEAMEKRTRAELEGRIPREKLDQLLLIIQKGGPEPELIVHAGAFLDMKEFFEVKSAFERARAEITSF
jgi:hypothetical protein